MESTFRKSDITDMKNFLSRDKDELRLPYAQSSSKYPRRTQFAASVNSSDFLLDLTGNRRYMPVVTQGMPTWSTDEIDQLWAEAWTLYASGRQWWPDNEEEVLLFAKAAQHTEKSHTEELLLRKFDWDTPPDNSTRWPASMLFNVLHGRPSNDKVQPLDARKTSEILRKLWGIPSGGNKMIKLANGSEMPIYAEGGKKRGFLMPPINPGETIGGPPATPDFSMSGPSATF
jgi:putative DNA primase/helicase